MRLLASVSATLLLLACGKEPDDSIDPVPAPTAANANKLMAEAERAATNAQARTDRQTKGERK